MVTLAQQPPDEAAVADQADDDIGAPRAVVETAFGLLASLQALGSARVSELQRHSRLPRTTVHRLLGQLEDVGAVERSGRRWRLGPTLIRFGAGVPAAPKLRSVARRPLMDLAKVTGACVTLSVEMADQTVVVDVIPGTRPLAHEPEPGLVVGRAELATAGSEAVNVATIRAHDRARNGDLRPVIDAGEVDPRVTCVAAPLRISSRDAGAVSLILPGRGSLPPHVVEATRRAAARIASQLAQPAFS